MPDGTSMVDTSVVRSEVQRKLEPLPSSVEEMLGDLGNELAALDLKPKYPPSVPETHSFEDGLMQNAQLLWTYRDEISNLLEDLTGKVHTETDLISLVKASILTDFGKVGTEKLGNGEIPQNLTARIYREFRWNEKHTEWLRNETRFEAIAPLLGNLSEKQVQSLRSNGKGRTVIPFRAAIEVMRQVALERYSDSEEEINSIFSFSESDEAELRQFGMDGNTPLASVFTALHCRTNAVLLPKLNIGIPERDYASGHHFPAGKELLPESVVAAYDLDGNKRMSEPFRRFVANTALLAVTDRLQGFVQRSGKNPQEAQEQTILSILSEVQTRFPDNQNRDQIEAIYVAVMSFVVRQRFVDHYAVQD